MFTFWIHTEAYRKTSKSDLSLLTEMWLRQMTLTALIIVNIFLSKHSLTKPIHLNIVMQLCRYKISKPQILCNQQMTHPSSSHTPHPPITPEFICTSWNFLLRSRLILIFKLRCLSSISNFNMFKIEFFLLYPQNKLLHCSLTLIINHPGAHTRNLGTLLDTFLPFAHSYPLSSYIYFIFKLDLKSVQFSPIPSPGLIYHQPRLILAS